MQEPKTKKPRSVAGLYVCRCARVIITTRKIDMMGLIYGQPANRSSGINKDLFTVEYLSGMDHGLLLKRFKPLVDSASPIAARALWEPARSQVFMS